MSRGILLLIVIPAISFFSALRSAPIAAAEAQHGPAASKSRPWLGIAIDKGTNGVLVKGVMPDTPAERAGFKVGDEVLSIDGARVSEPKRLIELVSASGIGTEVTVVLLRDAKKLTKSLKLVVRPDELKIVKDRLEGKPMPALNLPVIGRKESFDSKSLRGRVAVIEFWATWCPACRASHGKLSQFAAKHKDINVLGISDEDTETLESFVKETKPQFTVLQDVTQKSQADYMASAIPMFVVVKKNGDVALVEVGAGQELEQVLESAVKWSAQ